MSINFFDQFKNTVWSPPTQPTVYSMDWEQNFEAADQQERTNLINGWLWVLNRDLAYANDDPITIQASLSEIVDDLYSWLREALPYHTAGMFKTEVFDGSMYNLLEHTSRLPDETKATYATLLADLWFSNGAKQRRALIDLAELSTVWAQDKKGLPNLRQLVPNLAWRLAQENPADKWIGAHAARISVCSGLYGLPNPDNECLENKAWYCLARLSKSSQADPRVAFSVDAFKIISEGDPVTAAHNLPILMESIRNDTGKGSPYYVRQGVTRVFDQEPSQLTDYDVLRMWIPSMKSLWDASQSLDVPYTQACEQVVSQYLVRPEVAVSLPSNISDNGLDL